ncbi:hypothetical protein [Pasteuria penetrans]|uniref:hypothetical protein n=1 Tax=Pasteuria penetrans TaxID=86005 RepID=UPI000FBAB632|nr:hypothetical protein [Pasteuria penetrans]
MDGFGIAIVEQGGHLSQPLTVLIRMNQPPLLYLYYKVSSLLLWPNSTARTETPVILSSLIYCKFRKIMG